MDNSKAIIPGTDFINAIGYTFPVSKILYQDYYGDRSRAGSSDCWGYDVEFLDTDGRYHHWKQNQDGGGILRVRKYSSSTCFTARIDQWIGLYQDEVTLTIFDTYGQKRWNSHYHAGDVAAALVDLKMHGPGTWFERTN